MQPDLKRSVAENHAPPSCDAEIANRGILLTKHETGGVSFWSVKDAKTHDVLAVGESPSGAVRNYEISLENKKLEQELGVNLDDLSI